MFQALRKVSLKYKQSKQAQGSWALTSMKAKSGPEYALINVRVRDTAERSR
jgi:hypothetical protein